MWCQLDKGSAKQRMARGIGLKSRQGKGTARHYHRWIWMTGKPILEYYVIEWFRKR